MPIVKEDFLRRLEALLQDHGQELQPDDKERFVDQAVLLYSSDKPQKMVHEITGDGDAYDFDLPNDWQDNFSYVMGKIEYPSGEYQVPPYIEDADWGFIDTLSSSVRVVVLRFLAFVPESAKKARFTYAIPHTLSASSNTVYESDTEAVLALAASLCFWALAAKYAQSVDSTIEADVVDYQRKSDLYISLAQEQRGRYNGLMGIDANATGGSKRGTGASGNVQKEFDVIYPWGDDYLTHPRRQR